MATLSQVGIAGVGVGVLHPKLKNKWRVLFMGLGGVSGSNAGVTNDLSLQVVTVDRPNVQFEEVKLDRYNSSVYVPGKHSFDPCSMTVEDDITNRASNAIQTQLEKQQRLIGATGPWLNTEGTALAYKFSMKLELLDGNEAMVEQWVYEGCYIASVNYGNMDYSTSDKVTIDLSVRYDHARQVLVSAVTGSAIGGVSN